MGVIIHKSMCLSVCGFGCQSVDLSHCAHLELCSLRMWLGQLCARREGARAKKERQRVRLFFCFFFFFLFFFIIFLNSVFFFSLSFIRCNACGGPKGGFALRLFGSARSFLFPSFLILFHIALGGLNFFFPLLFGFGLSFGRL